jgi:hypothetical protein
VLKPCSLYSQAHAAPEKVNPIHPGEITKERAPAVLRGGSRFPGMKYPYIDPNMRPGACVPSARKKARRSPSGAPRRATATPRGRVVAAVVHNPKAFEGWWDADSELIENVRNCTDVHAFTHGFRGVVMTNERKELRSAAGEALARQARVARYRKQAVFFTRLAEGEWNATFRDRWKNLARECASSASRLENERATWAKAASAFVARAGCPKDVTRRRRMRGLASRCARRFALTVSLNLAPLPWWGISFT